MTKFRRFWVKEFPFTQKIIFHQKEVYLNTSIIALVNFVGQKGWPTSLSLSGRPKHLTLRNKTEKTKNLTNDPTV